MTTTSQLGVLPHVHKNVENHHKSLQFLKETTHEQWGHLQVLTAMRLLAKTDASKTLLNQFTRSRKTKPTTHSRQLPLNATSVQHEKESFTRDSP